MTNRSETQVQSSDRALVVNELHQVIVQPKFNFFD